jgi:hypothetical protein
MTRLNLTQSRLSNTICNQRQENAQNRSCRRKKAPPETARVEHALTPEDPLQQPNTTKHGNRDGTWPSHAAQGVKNTLARDDHAPVTNEHSGRGKQRQNWRTMASKAGGRVSTRGRWNRVDLALKNEKH